MEELRRQIEHGYYNERLKSKGTGRRHFVNRTPNLLSILDSLFRIFQSKLLAVVDTVAVVRRTQYISKVSRLVDDCAGSLS